MFYMFYYHTCMLFTWIFLFYIPGFSYVLHVLLSRIYAFYMGFNILHPRFCLCFTCFCERYSYCYVCNVIIYVSISNGSCLSKYYISYSICVSRVEIVVISLWLTFNSSIVQTKIAWAFFWSYIKKEVVIYIACFDYIRFCTEGFNLQWHYRTDHCYQLCW